MDVVQIRYRSFDWLNDPLSTKNLFPPFFFLLWDRHNSVHFLTDEALGYLLRCSKEPLFLLTGRLLKLLLPIQTIYRLFERSCRRVQYLCSPISPTQKKTKNYPIKLWSWRINKQKGKRIEDVLDIVLDLQCRLTDNGSLLIYSIRKENHVFFMLLLFDLFFSGIIRTVPAHSICPFFLLCSFVSFFFFVRGEGV